jgi:hypothetical protein
MRPPSPSVPATFGTVPTVVLAPVAGSSRTMSWASRREYSTEPSGRVSSPHGMSVSVATWVTPQTDWPHPDPVVTVAGALCGEVLPAASRAVTAYE